MYCGTDQHAGWASASAYSIGAIEEGCDWIEFTPSDSVTSALTQRANDTGSHIAGRDGSTGQTILKLVIRDFLKARGLDHGFKAAKLPKSLKYQIANLVERGKTFEI